jgi:hypothetical protein
MRRQIGLLGVCAAFVLASASTAIARDVPEVYPASGGRTEVRFDNRCIVVYGSDQRMLNVNQYCTASQVNSAIDAASRYFGGLGSGSTPSASTIRCESRNNQRAYCLAETAGGVRLTRKLSSSSCDYGRDWGYDQGGVWVTNGCRAEFEVGSVSAPSVSTVRCESRSNQRSYCRVDTAGGVQLARKLSSSSCDYRADWGYDANGIWVDNGCRAEFEVGGSSGWKPQVAQVKCESNDGKRQYCRVDTSGGVRLVEQLSSARCQYPVSWGYDPNGIWVNNGCRAVFEVGRGR